MLNVLNTMMLSKAKRQWKNEADEAISSIHYELERQRLAAEFAGRLDRGSLIRCFKDVYIRAFLAGNYLDALYDGAISSEYHDALALTIQARWTKSYYFAILEHPEVMGYPKSEEAPFWDMERFRRMRSDIGSAILRVAAAERVMAA